MNDNISKFKIALFFICSILSAQIALGQEEWRLDKDKDQVQVYTRMPEGLSFREFKAVTKVSASIKQIEELLDKYSEFPEWQSNMDSVSLVEIVNDSSKMLYFQSKLPWPITNRDFIFQQTKHFDRFNQKLTYYNKCQPSRIPEKKGFIRVEIASGFWEISRIDSVTKIVYQWAGDPAGAIPGWLVNLFIVDGPHQTLLNLRELLKE